MKTAKRDNQTLQANVSLRRQVLRRLDGCAMILEAYGGMGIIWRHCYDFPGVSGLVIERDPRKAEYLAMQRPTWPVIEGDNITLLAGGLGRHLTFTLLDLDAHGSPLPCLEAYLHSTRPLSRSWWIVATDGIGFALRRGSIPTVLQPALLRYGRQVLLTRYEAILYDYLTTLTTASGYQLGAWHFATAGSGRQLFHWVIHLQHMDTQRHDCTK